MFPFLFMHPETLTYIINYNKYTKKCENFNFTCSWLENHKFRPNICMEFVCNFLCHTKQEHNILLFTVELIVTPLIVYVYCHDIKTSYKFILIDLS